VGRHLERWLGISYDPAAEVLITVGVAEAIDMVMRAVLEPGDDLLEVSDEIYGDLTYGGHHSSIAELPDMRERTILLNGFSKAYAMTGWRIGYACGPAEILGAMMKIHQYTIMCAPIMGQMTAP
jgi:aminotransferase